MVFSRLLGVTLWTRSGHRHRNNPRDWQQAGRTGTNGETAAGEPISPHEKFRRGEKRMKRRGFLSLMGGLAGATAQPGFFNALLAEGDEHPNSDGIIGMYIHQH